MGMVFSGMSPEAPYAMNMEWGDSALANFFGTQAAADGADPLSFSFIQLNRSPETLRSNFVTSAQTGYFRDSSQTSKRFGLGTIPGSPISDSAGDVSWGIPKDTGGKWKLVGFALVAAAIWYAVAKG